MNISNGDYFGTNDFERCSEAALSGDLDAQVELGTMYRDGDGVPLNYTKAVELYSLAAEQGNAAAQNALGVMYQQGYGVTQNVAKAVELYAQSAAQGFVSAQYNLGAMYDYGKGVPKNENKALDWYSKAGEQGHLDAIVALGTLYFGRHDYTKATELWTKAANQGNARARDNLSKMQQYEKNMDKDKDRLTCPFCFTDSEYGVSVCKGCLAEVKYKSQNKYFLPVMGISSVLTAAAYFAGIEGGVLLFLIFFFCAIGVSGLLKLTTKQKATFHRIRSA